MTQSQALSVMKSGGHVFLTGEPGSGKTHTASEYVTYMRARGTEIAITASTGIAATHMGGMTIHSWSGIGVKTELSKQDLDAIAKNKYVSPRIRNAHVLIIEEVSMLSAATLTLVDVVCRRVRKYPLPFGGLQVIFVGDFFQLPPIIKTEEKENAQQMLIQTLSARFAYDAAVWKEMQPKVCYLTEQHRQDDNDYLNILSAIRRNVFNTTHLRTLEKRNIEPAASPQGVPKLFSHNSNVDAVNDEILTKLPGRERVFAMTSQGHERAVSSLQKSCLSPTELHLKVGAAVMFTKNNLKERFVNGTLGVIEGFDTSTKYPCVRTRGGRIIHVEPMEWIMEENGEPRAKITQVPLRLAWALTVHKSQGMSLDEAVVDLKGVFEFGQGYVALSRVRRLSGLYLLGWNDRAFKVHPEVLAQDEKFRKQSESTLSEMANKQITEAPKESERFGRARGSGTEHLLPQKAYRAWDEEQDHELRELYVGGASIADLAKEFSRTPGSIRSRLKKFSLIDVAEIY